LPAVRAYWARCEARPAYKAARALDGPQEFYTRDFYSWDGSDG
jgi:glutathione S-transferase